MLGWAWHGMAWHEKSFSFLVYFLLQAFIIMIPMI